MGSKRPSAKADRRRASLLVACALVFGVMSCGSEGGYGRPAVGAGPVAPLTLRFDNLTDGDLYLPMREEAAEFVVSREGHAIEVSRGCYTDCEFGCDCRTCVPSVTRFRRVAAGQSFVMSWEAVHFVVRQCSDPAGCSCVERWPMTAGRYMVEARAVDEVSGGEPASDDPDVVLGAVIAETAEECRARTEFDLAGGAEIAITFGCQ